MDRDRFVVDCRWLGVGGAGRATELLMRGLRVLDPPGEWTLWGPDHAAGSWSRPARRTSTAAPTALWGQRDVLSVPAHDAVLYMHQIRPLRGKRSVTLIHDTIPLRFDDRSLSRRLKHAYLRAVARRSTVVVTVSSFSKGRIADDLGVDRDRIAIARYPRDPELIARVTALSTGSPKRDALLWVGRYAPHKNLESLIRAHGASRFGREGGELLLVGIDAQHRATLRRFADEHRVQRVTLEAPCTQEELELLYATCRGLIMPSLEEGFGLPAWEAGSCGMPLALSDAGALPEVGGDRAVYFSPSSIQQMSAAIDAVVRMDRVAHPNPRMGPDLAGFARTFVDGLHRALAS